MHFPLYRSVETLSSCNPVWSNHRYSKTPFLHHVLSPISSCHIDAFQEALHTTPGMPPGVLRMDLQSCRIRFRIFEPLPTRSRGQQAPRAPFLNVTSLTETFRAQPNRTGPQMWRRSQSPWCCIGWFQTGRGIRLATCPFQRQRHRSTAHSRMLSVYADVLCTLS